MLGADGKSDGVGLDTLFEKLGFGELGVSCGSRVDNQGLNVGNVGKQGEFIANVTFEPGCRNNWHTHHADKGGGQILVCVDGEGWYQEWGKPAQKLIPGTVVTIPANVKHWHGAAKGSWFSHLAVEVPGENCSNEWQEPVTDEQYYAVE